MGERGQQQRVADHGARGGGEEADAVRRPRRKRQGQVGIPPAGGMVVDADAVEAGLLAAGDEGRELGQGAAHRHPEGDAETRCRPSPAMVRCALRLPSIAAAHARTVHNVDQLEALLGQSLPLGGELTTQDIAVRVLHRSAHSLRRVQPSCGRTEHKRQQCIPGEPNAGRALLYTSLMRREKRGRRQTRVPRRRDG